jgi:hypothetical protein
MNLSMMSMSMANLYWHAVRGQNGPEAGGLGADLRRGSSGGKTSLKPPTTFGCKPITFDLLALFSFAHFPNLPQIKSVSAWGPLMTEQTLPP